MENAILFGLSLLAAANLKIKCGFLLKGADLSGGVQRLRGS
jgi:hypothetical protein